MNIDKLTFAGELSDEAINKFAAALVDAILKDEQLVRKLAEAVLNAPFPDTIVASLTVT